jgi:hypothetical protein
MNYCVLIHLTRTSISFWYQQQGTPFEPLAKKEGNIVPLYFYVNGNNFIIGKFAKERFLNGDTTNTFGDYFKIIEDPSRYFCIFGNQKHVKFLLYYAVEQYLSHFLNTVLYKNDSIEEYRNNFPLRFIFSSDIVQKERLLVESLFSESGYDNIDTIFYSQFLFSFLANQKLIKPDVPILLLTGIDGNLFIELFHETFLTPSDQEIVEEHGADPRIKIMAKMLYENAIATTHFALNEKTELTNLLPFAKAFLDQQSALSKGDIILSDGTTCYVQVKKKELNERLTYDSGEEKIFKAIDNLIIRINIPVNNIQFVLNGESVNSAYFIDRLKKKFGQVIGTPPNTLNEVLKLAFRFISDAGFKASCDTRNKVKSGMYSDNTAQISTVSEPPGPPVLPPKPTAPQKVITPLLPPKIKQTTNQSTIAPPQIPPKPSIITKTVVSAPPPPPLPPALKKPDKKEGIGNTSKGVPEPKKPTLPPPVKQKKNT